LQADRPNETNAIMKILVVDDHALIREAMRGALKELDGEAVILEASDSRETMGLIEAHPDLELILLDLTLPDRDGFTVLTELRERYPAVSVVVMSALQDRDTVIKALDLGALGFIPKSAQRKVMISAVDRAAPSPGDLGLTGRQVDVLALMMQGKSNKAICRVLDLAEPTVKNHVTAILKALKVTNRTEAVIAVGEMKWELPPISGS
jgi:DNA-binding NarL/FixJ family response regulator